MKKNILKRGLATLTGLSLMASSLVNFPHIILADEQAQIVEEQTQDETVLEDAQIEQESEEVTQQETEVTEDISMQEEATSTEPKQEQSTQETTNVSLEVVENGTVSSEQQEKAQVVQEVEELIAPKSLENLRDYIKEIKESDLVDLSDELKDAKDISFEEENDTKVLHVDGRLYVIQKGTNYETDLETIQNRLIAQREEQDGIATYGGGNDIDIALSGVKLYVDTNQGTCEEIKDSNFNGRGLSMADVARSTGGGEIWYNSCYYYVPFIFNHYYGANGKWIGTYYDYISLDTTNNGAYVTVNGWGPGRVEPDKIWGTRRGSGGDPDLAGTIAFKVKPKSNILLVTGSKDIQINSTIPVDTGWTEVEEGTEIEQKRRVSINDRFIKDDFSYADEKVYEVLAEVLGKTIQDVKDEYSIEGWYTEPINQIGGQPSGDRYYYKVDAYNEDGTQSVYVKTQGTMPGTDKLARTDNGFELKLYPRIIEKYSNITLNLSGGSYSNGKLPGVAQPNPDGNGDIEYSNKGQATNDVYTARALAGIAVNIPQEPQLPGSRFVGWELIQDGGSQDVIQIYQTGQVIPGSKMLGNYILRAKWESLKSNITYDLDGGAFTNVPTDLVEQNGNYVKQDCLLYTEQTVISEQPTKAGYKFAGWELYSNTGVVDKQSGDKFRVEGNMTLKAKWDPYKYEITFNFGDENSLLPKEQQKLIITEKTGSSAFVNGEIVKLYNGNGENGITVNLENVPIPHKDGYTFIGWNCAGAHKKIKSTTSNNQPAQTPAQPQAQFDPDDTVIVPMKEDPALGIYTTQCIFNAVYVVDSSLVDVKFDLGKGSFTFNQYGSSATDFGNKIETIEYKVGSEINLATLPTPVCENQLFDGWTITGAQPAEILAGKIIVKQDSKLTFKANYKPMPTNLTINTDKGSYTENELTDIATQFNMNKRSLNLAQIPQPTRDGYEFKGWELTQTKSDGTVQTTSYSAGSTDTVSLGDKTNVEGNVLTAVWEKTPEQVQLPNGNTGGGSSAGVVTPVVPNVPNVPVAPTVPTVPQNPDSSNSNNNGNSSNGTNGSNGTDNSNGADGTNGADSSNGSDSTQGGNGASTGNDNTNGDVNNNTNDNINDTNKDVSDDINNDNINDILANLNESEENQINSIFGNMFDDLFSNFSSLFVSNEFIQENLLPNGENENGKNQMFIAGLENSNNGQDNDGSNGTGGSNSDKESFIKSKVLKPFFGFGANKIVTTFAWLLLLLIALTITYTVKKQIFSNKDQNSQEEEDTNVLE